MKDKLSQIHQTFRRQSLEHYFKERRLQLIEQRQQHSLAMASCFGPPALRHSQNGWRSIVLHGAAPRLQDSFFRQANRKGDDEMDFDMNLTSIEAGQYYLNILIDGAAYNYLEETIRLLGKLVSKVINVGFKVSFSGQKLQNQIIFKALQQIHYYLTIGQHLMTQSQPLAFRNCQKTKRILRNLLEEDYRPLLQREQSGIIIELINITYELCATFMMEPNYQVVRYILTRVITKDNLLFVEEEKREKSCSAQSLNQKIEQILMKFVILLRPQESGLRKTKNIHSLQVIHEFYRFIQYNLVNIYEFIRNNEHPFDYQHINNTLYFTLTLYTQIIAKFQHCLKNTIQGSTLPTILCPAIIEQLYNITLMHSRSVIVERDKDEFILTIEETVSKVLSYVLQEKGRFRMGSARMCAWQEWQVDRSDRYLLDALMLIRRCLREIEQSSTCI